MGVDGARHCGDQRRSRSHGHIRGRSLGRSSRGSPVCSHGDNLRQLRLFEGFSSDVHLSVGYSLVVHEILGHIASSEGVVKVILDLRQRGLLNPNCIFVPRRAMTLFAPTEQIQFTCMERILHLHVNGPRAGEPAEKPAGIGCLTKHHATRFPEWAALAAPSLFEDLCFGGELCARQTRTVVFRTTRAGIFDGLHFHMIVELSDGLSINTLLEETSWRTTYIKLMDPGIQLVRGSRIVCETLAELDHPEPFYRVSVAIGEAGEEHTVAVFSWSGSS